MCKKRYTSSVMFQAASYKMAQRIGMSDGRIFTKYLNYAIELGLVTVQHDRYVFAKWTTCIRDTFNLKHSQARYFDKPFNGFSRFKQYQYYIEQSLLGLNYKQQDHNIQSKHRSKDKINQGSNDFNTWCATQLLRIAKKAKEANQSGIAYHPTNVLRTKNRPNTKTSMRGDKRNVVTGINHISKIIGRSHTTANKRIKMLAERELIQYKDIVHYKDTVIDHRAIQVMNETKKLGTLILPTNTGYKVIYGKQVISFSLGLFRKANTSLSS